MGEVQPPEGLLDAVTKIVSEKWGPCEDDVCEADRAGIGTDCTAARGTVADVLAALFDACTVREQPHMWLHGGIRTERSLILSYRLPDEPMPEPGPMHPDLAAALARARARVSSTGEETTDGAPVVSDTSEVPNGD